MNNHECKVCKNLKPLSDFRPSDLRNKKFRCRECTNEHERKFHGDLRRQAWVDNATASRAKNRKWLQEYKQSTPCADCEHLFPYYVMDLDHKDPTTKKYEIARIMASTSISLLKEEVAKCEVVCANCHRIRTFKRRPK